MLSAFQNQSIKILISYFPFFAKTTSQSQCCAPVLCILSLLRWVQEKRSTGRGNLQLGACKIKSLSLFFYALFQNGNVQVFTFKRDRSQASEHSINFFFSFLSGNQSLGKDLQKTTSSLYFTKLERNQPHKARIWVEKCSV